MVGHIIALKSRLKNGGFAKIEDKYVPKVLPGVQPRVVAGYVMLL